MAPSRLDDREAPSYKGHPEEADIDLRDLFRVVFKRRKLIALVFAAAVTIAAARTKTIPKVYEVSMFIEPPVMGLGDADDKFDPVVNMKSTIEVGAYNRKILDDLRLGDGNLQFTVFQPKDTRLIKVSLYREAGQTDEGVKILSKLIDVLDQRYAVSVDETKTRLDGQIKALQRQGGTKTGEIKVQNATYKIRFTQEGQTLEGMQGKLLSMSRDSLRNVRVIQEPFVSPQPVDGGKKKGVVWAGMVGLALGVVLAFLVEYWADLRA